VKFTGYEFFIAAIIITLVFDVSGANRYLRASEERTLRRYRRTYYMSSVKSRYRILKNLVRITLVFNCNRRVFTFISYRHFGFQCRYCFYLGNYYVISLDAKASIDSNLIKQFGTESCDGNYRALYV